MIDFVNIEVVNAEIDFILSVDWLEWKCEFHRKTGEITKHFSQFRNLDIEYFPLGKMKISGSLHKYYNIWKTGEEQNYNSFNHRQLIETISELCERFKAIPAEMKLHSFEFGVNVPLDDPNEYLRNAIIHKDKQFNQEWNDHIKFRECEREQYTIKIYNKTLHQSYGGLRIEVKIHRMIKLAKKVDTMQDFLLHETISFLGETLISEHKKILFYDETINVDELPLKDKDLLLKGRAPAYWSEIQEKGAKEFKRKRDKFEEIIQANGQSKLKEVVSGLIFDRWNTLKNDTFSVTEISDLCHKLTLCKVLKCGKGENKEGGSEATKKASVKISKVVHGVHEKKRVVCQVCGDEFVPNQRGSNFKYCKKSECKNIVKSWYNEKYRLKEIGFHGLTLEEFIQDLEGRERDRERVKFQPFKEYYHAIFSLIHRPDFIKKICRYTGKNEKFVSYISQTWLDSIEYRRLKYICDSEYIENELIWQCCKND